MLFSRKDVADYINQYFEPVWESVRPVPVVRIDFGNGTVVNRTLHGNIATYVCNADGQTLDILPGIYAPGPYVAALKQFRLLANYVDQKGKDKRAERLRDYHKGQAEALRKKEAPPTFFNLADVSKCVIEGGVKAVLIAGGKTTKGTKVAKVQPKLIPAEDLANWKELAEDSRQNESNRRRQIHEMLAKSDPVGPAAVTKRLYKEVLHADLDDPYLGLGPLLFGNYAFAKEEKSR